MTVLDALGQEIEIYVRGSAEEPVIDDASYADGRKCEVSEATIDYIYKTYPDLLSDAAYNFQLGEAEAWADMAEER